VRVAGLDGTKGGWATIILEEGLFSDDRLLPVETRFDELSEVSILAIDIPIGFGPRAADSAAREFLRGAASTVFTTPSRALFEQPFGPGLGISAQAHALGPRIMRVTQLAAADDRIYEVHPEVCFRAMNACQPLRYRKKSAGGALERLALLRRHRIDVGDLGETAHAPLDDVLDAAAAAWTACRLALGTAKSLPERPEIVDGRSVAIWY